MQSMYDNFEKGAEEAAETNVLIVKAKPVANAKADIIIILPVRYLFPFDNNHIRRTKINLTIASVI